MHELLEPPRAVVDRFASVVLQFGVVGVEKAANAGMTGAIGVNQLAVLAHAATPPDVDLRLGIEFTGRQLDHCRKHVGFRIGIHTGPGRLASKMRLGEIPFAPDIEQILDPIEIEEESVTAAAGKKSVWA